MNALWALLSSADVLVGHYASVDFKKSWDAVWIVPKWGLKVWLVGVAVSTAVFAIEYSYRQIKKHEAETEPLIKKLGSDLERLRNPNFNFVVTHEDTPQTLNSGQIGVHRRIVVANDSDAMAVNCELAVENTSLALTGFTCNSALPVKDGNGARRANIHQRSTLHFDLFVTFLFFNTDVPQLTKLCTSTWPDLPIDGESQETIDLRLAGDNIPTRSFQIRIHRNARNVEIEDFRLQL